MEDDKIKNLFIEAASESIPITKNQEEVFRETQILKAELIVEENKNKWFEFELSENIIEIMTVFCAKLYGKRSNKNKTALNHNEINEICLQ